MLPVYVDVHIHTSMNPDSLNTDYDTVLLIKKVKEKARSDNFLISFGNSGLLEPSSRR